LHFHSYSYHPSQTIPVLLQPQASLPASSSIPSTHCLHYRLFLKHYSNLNTIANIPSDNTGLSSGTQLAAPSS
jgi:hypothetical protein